ncbi:hypothetical protein SDRG_09796 [Saprolegnia diclina VS20]|uniref:Uncharacterized protein n=1 Tax=Saprolegnia diclina (strain VS20) TaxID=1156394 RepID=T0Q3U6_SAPDV|nr:hypothetical protein SDRG_09796 [Saprolegnia diclina VS20]EQC32469.1 hypothetical protein SDRG_09796 [Saprolegnia diclina VS20]|eukprot:XP_008613970.1 hypothetical protein SDRG_09796 [Saprolegnia diclina VS20]
MELAAFNGDLTSLELLHKSRLRVGSERAIVYAAYRGHMHVLDWLHQNRRDGCGEDAMALAATAGHLNVVRWLHEIYGLWRTHAALATAAYKGHLAMVTYLLGVPTDSSGPQGDARALDAWEATSVLRSPDLVAIIIAYQEGLPGDIAVVQRLADAVQITRCFSQRPPTAYLAHVPARFASLPYLQRYPHSTTKLPHHALFVSSDVYDRALAHHLSVVEGDVALVQRWLRWDASLCTSATLELAAAASQGPILRLLFEQFPALATPKMMDLVAMSGDLPLLLWLHEAGVACTTAAMDGAAMNGHYDIVIFLHSARTEGCTIAAATAAAVNGHASIVRFLLEQRTEGVDPTLQFSRPHGKHKTCSVNGTTPLEAVNLVAATTELSDTGFTAIVDKGSLVTLQYVYSRGYLKRMTNQVLELAVAKQDHEMLRYILDCVDQENPLRPSDEEWLPPVVCACDLHSQVSTFNGDLVSLELLHKSRLRVGSERAIVYAAYRGHMHTQWLSLPPPATGTLCAGSMRSTVYGEPTPPWPQRRTKATSRW